MKVIRKVGPDEPERPALPAPVKCHRHPSDRLAMSSVDLEHGQLEADPVMAQPCKRPIRGQECAPTPLRAGSPLVLDLS
jgi:hypothetical protein